MEPIKQVTLEKTYDASPETVWQAWTKPEMLKQWWGPDNVTIPQCEVDLKVGGKFYIVMEAGEGMGPYKGTLWPMEAQFTVVEPNAKLSYTAQAWTEGHKEETTIEQTTEITFTEEANKTKVKVIAAIYKAGPGAKMAAEGMQYGFTQQLEKLIAFLAGKK
ncbi:MAG: SRPBCC domain-containing protein [Candidatus Doudnabacteria bacterium]|nr:SRPBCC domain-containing protein [Candidatus Doudnabacteria bacterium]